MMISLDRSNFAVPVLLVVTVLISCGNLHSVYSFVPAQTSSHHCKLTSSSSSQCSGYYTYTHTRRSRLYVAQEVESTAENSSGQSKEEKSIKEKSSKGKLNEENSSSGTTRSNTSMKNTEPPSPTDDAKQTSQKRSETPKNDDDSSDPTLKITSDKTLYEILNSNPEATRSEIKRNYIALVRQTHPDAQINKEDVDDDNDDNSPEFQEIMIAWRTLSDPLQRKRYDRDLRAKEFTYKVERVVGNIGKKAGPQFLNAFENIAIPFLRRSAATTVAGFTSISEDIANYGTNNSTSEAESGLGGIIVNAVKSGQKAGRAIDCIELMEKSRELSKKADREAEKARTMKEQLSSAMNKRINLTLHTPNAKLTSLEACMILDGMNTPDTLKMTDMLRLRRTVAYEIEQLQNYENDFKSNRELNLNLHRDVERKSMALEQAQANAKAAVQAEIRARKALEDAKNLVASTNDDVQQSTVGLAATSENLKYNELELQKVSTTLAKQQEKVRVALRRKEEALFEAEEIVRGDFKAESLKESEETIEALLKEERYLRAESARVEALAARLSSRSKKLEINSEKLEKDEAVAWEALEEGIEEGMRVAEEATKGGYGKYGKYD